MIVNLKTLLDYAEEKKIAIGSFNYSNVDGLIAIIEAAEQLNVPVIVSHAPVHNKYFFFDRIIPIAIEMAKKAKVMVCVHLDHGTDVDYIKHGIDMGVTSVMFDGSSLPIEENSRITQEVVQYAQKYNVSVEAELGRLSSYDSDEGSESEVNQNPELFYTNPKEAQMFIKATNIDCLAIAFGTVHGKYVLPPKLSVDVITETRKITQGFPLVMHGGSGVSEADYKNVIQAGIRKINYYSYNQMYAYDAVKMHLKTSKSMYYHDIVKAAYDAMLNDYIRIMKIFYNK